MSEGGAKSPRGGLKFLYLCTYPGKRRTVCVAMGETSLFLKHFVEAVAVRVRSSSDPTLDMFAWRHGETQ